jgi:uncharacterized caspase-like protein
VATALKTLGFEVVAGFDLDKAGMDRQIREFAEKLSGAAVGLLFYAGHGLQIDGQNYLVPVDAELTTAAALDLDMVPLDLLQRTMERAVSTNIIFLDACRDNPLARNLARALGTRSRSVQIGRGLAQAQSGEGTLISFSTQPGNVALDGKGPNSPYSASLAKHLAVAGDDLSTILIKVRNDVMRATQRRQVPWEHSALTDRFYFIPPAPPGPTQEQLDEIARWEAIKSSSDPAKFRSYLKDYPQGNFATVARMLIDQLEKQLRAERAAREQQLKQIEESRKAAEVARLEELQRVENAKQAEELRRAEEAKDMAEAARLDQERKAKELERAEWLSRAREEERVARDASQAAEKQRLAAANSVEEIRKAADLEAKKAADKIRGVRTTEKRRNGPLFDGLWTINWRGVSNCHRGIGGKYVIHVNGGLITSGRRSGRVSPSGKARWGGSSQYGGHVDYSGTLHGKSGSGRFKNTKGCQGTFTARKD